VAKCATQKMMAPKIESLSKKVSYISLMIKAFALDASLRQVLEDFKNLV
jgi:hypothetical protein